MMARFFSYLTAIVNKNAYTARLFNYIMNNPLYRGVAVLGSGTAVAQLISIVTAPIITRLYTPSDMGVLAVYSSVLAIVGIGATLSYELAYALPRDNEDAINLFGLSLMLLCITTTVLALILLFGRRLLMNIFDLGALEQYIWFLLIGFFGRGLYTTLNYWAVRQRDYGRITYTKINQGIGGSVCKILLGIFSFGPIGLIIGQIVSGRRDHHPCPCDVEEGEGAFQGHIVEPDVERCKGVQEFSSVQFSGLYCEHPVAAAPAPHAACAL